jgi:hypothetical protein
MAQAYTYARQAGFDPAAAVIMAAIDMAESGLNPNAEGDIGLQTSVWGPSVGLGQIRTLKAQTGTGKTRDIARLKDPAGNMAAAYEISNHGRDFTPWTTYTSGKYRQFLGQAKSAAASGAGSTTNTGVTVQPAGLTDVLTSKTDWRGIGLTAGALLFGVGLLLVGGYVAVGSPDIKLPPIVVPL